LYPDVTSCRPLPATPRAARTNTGHLMQHADCNKHPAATTTLLTYCVNLLRSHKLMQENTLHFCSAEQKSPMITASIYCHLHKMISLILSK